MSIRLRFAPSPTGFLHIGGVRTALFNWLYAKHHGGKFLLRIEDTDKERSEQCFTDDILAAMKWLGLSWDEEIYYQSEHQSEHISAAEKMVADGNAYYCYCTEGAVQAMREKARAEGRKPMYDRTCRDKELKARDGGPCVVRAKIPLDGGVEFDDLIRGKITVANSEIDDFVLLRSGGAPTYNLGVVCDDLAMKLTHIVRGDDHINNTPKQIHLYRFLGAAEPKFAHLPMILGTDKKKLSKRHGEVSTNAYREKGYLPEVMLNFLVRLGWSHGDQEVFSVKEMIEHFDFDHVQKSSAVFNPEKLEWLSGVHIRAISNERFLEVLREDFKRDFSEAAFKVLSEPLGLKLAALVQQKVKTLAEVGEMLSPLLEPSPVEVDPSALKWNKKPELKAPSLAAVKEIREFFGGIAGSGSLGEVGWDHEKISEKFKEIAKTHGLKLGDLAGPVRLWLTGRMVSVGAFELLSIVPWAWADERLSKIN